MALTADGKAVDPSCAANGFSKRTNPVKVFDCMMVWQEIDQLEVRLHELYDVVDHFVLVESPWSLSGAKERCHLPLLL